MNSSNYNIIQKYITKGNKIAWNGRFSLPGMTSAHIAEFELCRLKPDLHHQFDLVISIENGLESCGNSWEAQLDELTRLLSKTGTLIIKFNQSTSVNLISVKRYLWRSLVLDVNLIEQWSDHEQNIFIVLQVTRKYIDSYEQKNWTFALISDGKRPENVKKFIKSVKAQRGGPHEILIIGPKIAYDGARNIVFHDDKLPRIAEKKNIIGAGASNQNICIAHDRYELDSNFIVNWESFGYDYDFCTVAQRTENGKVYPSLVSMPEKIEKWQSPNYSSDGMYSDGNFINGGFFVIKKHLISSFPMNSLSLHNEAEDVEYSWSLRYHGISTRCNTFSKAIALGNPTYGAFTEIILNELSGVTPLIKLKKVLYVIYKLTPFPIRNSKIVLNLKRKLK